MIRTVVLFIASLFHFVFAHANCPAPGTIETQQDCPWAEIARATSGLHPISYSKKIRSIFNSQAPGFLDQLKQDRKVKGLLDLWGISRNSNEGQEGSVIVPHNLLDYFANELGHIPFDSTFLYGNAGLTHTYGYLFSNLGTKYGYKRARYVGGDIERGFGLTPGLFGGVAREGTLLSNFTYFIGSIALQRQPFSLETLPRELANYAYGKVRFTRVTETVQTEQGKLIIYSDFVPFPNQRAGASAQENSALFIYSLDEGDGQKLITAFPVNKKFGEDLVASGRMGPHQEIKIGNNGWLKRGKPELYKGTREKREYP